MSEKRTENNSVHVNGRIVSGFRYSHEIFGEGFFLVDISVCRESGYMDVIPAMVSDRIVDTDADYTGVAAAVTGQFRSHNRHGEKKNRLELYIFVQELEFPEGEPEEGGNDNRISLKGYVCKVPVYRNTPLGREIADILLAVNRPYGKSDYIPCIAWGRNARMAEKLEVGEHISIQGRIQSREYRKQLPEGETEVRVAYEVSVSMIKVETEDMEGE